MVVLIAAAIIVISVTVCLKKRKRNGKHVNTFTDNVAYGVSENEMELFTNVAYTATSDSYDKGDTHIYATISVPTSPNMAHVPVSNNQAYGIIH